MNNVVMMGRLTRPADVRYSAGNNPRAVARINIAVDRRFKRDGQPTADFFNCVAFGKTAEFIEKYLDKGTKVVLRGELQNDNYKNREGQMIYRDQIVIEQIEFAESKKASRSNEAESETTSQPEQKPDENGFMDLPDSISEELPFT